MARSRRKKGKGRPRPRRGPLRLLLAGMLSVAVALGLTVAVGFLWIDAHLPDVFRFDDYRGSALQVTRVLAADGRLIDELFVERRTVVPLEAVPRVVRDAVIAAEDGGFYEHSGLDFAGILRALARDVAEQRFAQGGSTITQQVARTFYLSSEKTLGRKLREAVLAMKLERELSKDAILALYLNQIYFGHGRYGIQEASRFYFGKDVQAVTLGEAALLAGIVQSPGRLSPFVSADGARRRRQYVLDQMVGLGLVEPDAARDAAASALPERSPRPELLGVAPYFAESVRRELVARVGVDAVLHGGLRVRTTLDPRLQDATEAAIAAGVMAADERGEVWSAVKRGGAGTARRLARRWAKKHGARRPASGQLVRGVVSAVHKRDGAYAIDTGVEKGSLAFADLVPRYAPTVARAASLLRRNDVVPVSFREDAPSDPGAARSPTLSLELGPQAAAVVLDPATGAVRALVGGTDFAGHPFNRALQAHRQAGSTFKTFVYASALEKGVVTSDTEIDATPHSYRNGRGGVWRPRNHGVGDDEMVTLRRALAESMNGIAVEVLRLVGVDAVRELAARLGIRSPLGRDLTLALGSSEVTLFELTAAYGTFAGDGVRAEPRWIDSVLDAEGRNIWPDPPPPARVLEARVSREIVGMLREVVVAGTGKAATVEGVEVAGKTGTSDDARDSWFVGFAPGLCVGVWVGFDDGRPLGQGGGGTVAAPIFRDLVSTALGRPVAAGGGSHAQPPQ